MDTLSVQYSSYCTFWYGSLMKGNIVCLCAGGSGASEASGVAVLPARVRELPAAAARGAAARLVAPRAHAPPTPAVSTN